MSLNVRSQKTALDLARGFWFGMVLAWIVLAYACVLAVQAFGLWVDGVSAFFQWVGDGWRMIGARRRRRRRRRNTLQSSNSTRRNLHQQEMLEDRRVMAADWAADRVELSEDFATTVVSLESLAPQLSLQSLESNGSAAAPLWASLGDTWQWTVELEQPPNQAAVVDATVESDSLVLTSRPDANGTAILTLSAFDGERYASMRREITVVVVNDAPQVSPWSIADRTFVTNEGEDFAIDMQGLFWDVDSENLSVAASPIAHSVAGDPIVGIQEEDGQLLVTLDEDLFGISQWSITASDATGKSASTSFWINVTSDNDAPRGALHAQRLQSVNADAIGAENTTRYVDLPAFFWDPEQTGPLEFSIVGVSNAAAFRTQPTVDENHTLILAPAWDLAETVTSEITLRVTDDHGASIEQTVTVEVEALPPYFTGVVYRGATAACIDATPAEVGEAEDDGDEEIEGDLDEEAAGGVDDGDGDEGEEGAGGAGDGEEESTADGSDTGNGVNEGIDGVGDGGGSNSPVDSGDTPIDGGPDGPDGPPGPGADVGGAEDSDASDSASEGANDVASPEVDPDTDVDSPTGDGSPQIPVSGDSDMDDAPNADEGGDEEEADDTDLEDGDGTTDDTSWIGDGPSTSVTEPPPTTSVIPAPSAAGTPAAACEVAPEHLTWQTNMGWSDEPVQSVGAGLVPLNNDFDRGYQELVTTEIDRGQWATRGWTNHSNVHNSNTPNEDAAGESVGSGEPSPAGIAEGDSHSHQFELLQIEQLVPLPDNDPSRRTERGLHEYDDLRHVSFGIGNQFNRRLPLDLAGQLTFEFSENIRVWRVSDKGIVVPVASGEEIDLEWRIEPKARLFTEFQPEEVIDESLLYLFPLENASGGLAVDLYIEGMEEGSGQITAHFNAPASPWLGDDAQYENSHQLDFFVGTLDLDGDTDNNGSLDRDEHEERWEAHPNGPGLRVESTLADRDHDLVVDAIDGLNLNAQMDADNEVTVDESVFQRVVIEVPEGIPLEDAIFAFDYPEVALDQDQLQHHGIRVWSRDQPAPRSMADGGDLPDAGDPADSVELADVSSGIVHSRSFNRSGFGQGELAPRVYAYGDLVAAENRGTREIELFVEGVNPGRYELTASIGLPAASAEEGEFHYGPTLGSEWLQDTLILTVESTVSILASDQWAQESTVEGSEDHGQFIVTRGEFDTSGDLVVYYQVDTGGLSNAGEGDYTATWPRPMILPDSSATGSRVSSVIETGVLAFDPVTGFGSVLIPDGADQTVIDIVPIDDDAPEWDEQIRVRLVTWAEYAAAHSTHADPSAWVAPDDGRPGAPSPYRLGHKASAAVTILDNDHASVVGSSNHGDQVDSPQPLVHPATPHANVKLRTGRVDVTTHFDGLRYTDAAASDQPVVEVLFRFPWAPDLLNADASLTAVTTVAGIRSEPISYDMDAVRAHISHPLHRHDPLRIVALGPQGLDTNLPTGRYDLDVELQFISNGERRTRTIRGGLDWINRTETRFKETELGAAWDSSFRQKIYAQDNVTPTARMDDGEFTAETTSRLASFGARPMSGAWLQRGDGTSAWFESTPHSGVGSQVVEFSDEQHWSAFRGRRVSSGGLQQRADAARWTVAKNSSPPFFQLFVNWDVADGRASNAFYTVNGARLLDATADGAEFSIDQRVTPGEVVRGTRWRSLGFFQSTGEADVTVTLSTQSGDGKFSDGTVSAGNVALAADWNFVSPNGASGTLDFGIDSSDTFRWSDRFGDQAEFTADGKLESLADRQENMQQLHYVDADGDGRIDDLHRVVTQGGLTTTYGYQHGLISWVEDFAGRRHQIQTVGGLVRSIELPQADAQDHAVWEFGYDVRGRLKAVVDPLGASTQFHRDVETGAITSVVDPANHLTKIQPQWLDGMGSNVGEWQVRRAPRGRIGTYAPNEANKLDDPAAHVVYGAEVGAPTWIYQTDAYGYLVAKALPPTHDRPRSDTWLWQRGADGQVLQELAPAGGGGDAELERQRTIYSYRDGDLVNVAYADGSSESWAYGRFGLPQSHVDPLGVQTDWERDDYGNLTVESEMINAETTRTTRRQYTPAPQAIMDLPGGLLTEVSIGAEEQQRVMRYDRHNHGVQVGLIREEIAAPETLLESATRYEYDARRNLVKTTHVPTGAEIEFRYDGRDRLVQRTMPAPAADAERAEWNWKFDAMGNVLLETLPNEAIHRYEYDALGRQTWDFGVVDQGVSLEFAREYRYDAMGNLRMEIVHRDDANEVLAAADHIIYRDYDARGQLTLQRANNVVIGDDPAQTVAGAVTRFHYDAWGQVARQDEGYMSKTLRQSTFEYDTLGQLVRSTLYADGTATTSRREFDANGRVVLVDDPASEGRRQTRFSYDNLGRLVKSAIPDGRGALLVEQTTWSLWDQKLTSQVVGAAEWSTDVAAAGGGNVVDGDGQSDGGGGAAAAEGDGAPQPLVSYFYYDLLGRLTANMAPAPNEDTPPLTTYYAYDSAGNDVRTLLEAAPVNTGRFNPAGGISANVLDEIFASAQEAMVEVRMAVVERDELGRVVSQRNAEDPSRTAFYAYDVMGNVIHQRDRSETVDGATTLYSSLHYDALSRLIREEGPSTIEGQGPARTTNYDRGGAVETTTVFNGSLGAAASPWSTTAFQYDSHGRLLATNTSEMPLSILTYHDDWGRLLRRQGEGLGEQQWVYNGRDQVVESIQETGTATTKYFDNGLLAETQDASGVVRKYRYDVNGRLLNETIQRGGGNDTTRYEYDAQGRMILAVDPLGAETRFKYDSHGQLQMKIRAGSYWAYSYDAFGNLITQVDPMGRTSRYAYDTQGRLLEETWWEDAAGDAQVYAAKYTRTPFGELLEATDWTLDEAASLSDGDVDSGQPNAPNGPPLQDSEFHSSYSYQYDSNRRLDQVWQAWGDLDVRYGVDYDFDHAGNLTALSTRSNGATPLTSGQFEYDSEGRLTKMTEVGAAATSKRADVRYLSARSNDDLRHGVQWELYGDGWQPEVRTEIGYRGDGRMTHVRHVGVTSQNISSLDLEYDAAGRLHAESRKVEGEVEYTREYQYDAKGQLLTSDRQQKPIQYDAAGNRVGRLDLYHRLVEDARSEYEYDAVGNVVAQIRYSPVASAVAESATDDLELPPTTLLAGAYRLWVEYESPMPVGSRLQLWNGDTPFAMVNAVADQLTSGGRVVVPENIDLGNLHFVAIDAAESPLTLPVGTRVEIQRARHYSYEFDVRNRVTQVTQWADHQLDQVVSVSRWEYDVMGNVVRQYRDDLGDGVLEDDHRFVSSTIGTMLELNGEGDVQRTRWLTPYGKLVSVENVGTDNGANHDANGFHAEGPIWALADHQDTIRDLVHGEHVTHLRYDIYGRPLEQIDSAEPHELWDSITSRFAQFEFNTDQDIYVRDGRIYEPQSGRYLSDSGVAGKNGYLFAGNAPVNPNNVVSEGVAYNAPLTAGEQLRTVASNFHYYAHPLHNPPGRYSGLAATAKVLGWTMYTVGSIGGGTAATVAAAAAKQGVWSAIKSGARGYLARQFVFAGAEVGVEYAMHGGGEFHGASRLGYNMVLNTLTGVMVGGGSVANRVAGYLGRQTLEGSIKVGVDLSRGRNFVDSISYHSVTGLGGELVARGAIGTITAVKRLPQMKTWARRSRHHELIVSRVPGNIKGQFNAVRPGPLSPPVASSFAGGRYAMIELSEDLRLYRVWDPHGAAHETGGYWSLDPPFGPLQSQIDLALVPEFKNAALRWSAVNVPAGRNVYVGEVGSQRAAFVGGGSQVLVEGGVDSSWLAKLSLERRDYSYKNIGSNF